MNVCPCRRSGRVRSAVGKLVFIVGEMGGQWSATMIAAIYCQKHGFVTHGKKQQMNGTGGQTMKTVDIAEVFVTAIEEKIMKEWKHEGGILGWSSEQINFEIDGKEYTANVKEVKDGGHWSDNFVG